MATSIFTKTPEDIRRIREAEKARAGQPSPYGDPVSNIKNNLGIIGGWFSRNAARPATAQPPAIQPAPAPAAAQPVSPTNPKMEYAERFARDQAASGRAVNQYNSSPLSARPPQTGNYPAAQAPAPRPAQGPMTSVYADDGRTPLPGQEQKYLDAYNNGTTQQRAGLLSRIWEQGGVPVIGSGTQSAPRSDFGGIIRYKANEYANQLAAKNNPYSVSVDTGIRAGSRGAFEHQAALNKHANQSGVYGGDGRQKAYDMQGQMKQRGGLFANRAKRNESRAERKQREALELERAKNEGQIGYAKTMAEASRQDRAAAREERRAEIADNRRYEQGIARREAQSQAQKDAAAQAEKEHSRAVASQQPSVENTPSGPMRVSYDEKGIKKYESYLSPDESKAWRQAQTDKRRFRASFPPEQMAAWLDGNNTTPVIDTQTGDFVFIDNKTLGKAQKSKEESQRYAKIENAPFLGEEFANYKRAVDEYRKSMKSKKPAPAA